MPVTKTVNPLRVPSLLPHLFSFLSSSAFFPLLFYLIFPFFPFPFIFLLTFWYPTFCYFLRALFFYPRPPLPLFLPLLSDPLTSFRPSPFSTFITPLFSLRIVHLPSPRHITLPQHSSLLKTSYYIASYLEIN